MATGPSESQVPQLGTRLSNGSRDIPSRFIRKQGKEKQAAQIAALQAQLKETSLKLSLSVQRQAAITCATDAALGFCVRHGASTAFTHALGNAISLAMHNLASSDSYVLVAVAEAGDPAASSESEVSAIALEDGSADEVAPPLTPGAEAVVSAANGSGYMGSSVPTPGAEAVASAADDLGNSSCVLDSAMAHHAALEGFVSQDLATTAGPLQFEIFDAADDTWLCANELGKEAASADAAAGVTASQAGKLPALHQLNSSMVGDFGGGTSVTTPGAGIPVDCIPGSSSPGAQIDAVGCHEACTPGSSNPGAQNGAAVFCLYNAVNKVSSYCEGHYDTGRTAVAERQCGHVATARHNIGDIAVQDAQPVHSDAIGDGMSEESVENSKDFNSQHLDKLAVSSYGPLPPEVIADFNSQGIAHTVSKCDSSSCTPGSSNPGAQNGAEDVSFFNAGQKVTSYSEGQYDSGKTAFAGDIAVHYGPLRLGDSQDAHPVLFDAIGGGISEEHDGNLKDSNSQESPDFDSQDLAAHWCGPLPSSGSSDGSSSAIYPGAEAVASAAPVSVGGSEEHGGNLKDFISQESPDFDSQDLAAHRCGPLPSSDANADARNAAEELVRQLEALLERVYRDQHDYAIPAVLKQLQSARSRLNDFNSGGHLTDLD